MSWSASGGALESHVVTPISQGGGIGCFVLVSGLDLLLNYARGLLVAASLHVLVFTSSFRIAESAVRVGAGEVARLGTEGTAAGEVVEATGAEVEGVAAGSDSRDTGGLDGMGALVACFFLSAAKM
jgi:hypothetical protein